MVEAYRITQTKYAATAFDGRGAKLYGGRWNSAGVAVVYVAGSLSLATLEILVHMENFALIRGRYSHIPLRIPEAVIYELPPEELPEHWNNPQPNAGTQRIGDAWVEAATSAVLRVPTVISEGEYNYLLNPAHPDFEKIQIGKPQRFEPDERLIR